MTTKPASSDPGSTPKNEGRTDGVTGNNRSRLGSMLLKGVFWTLGGLAAGMVSLLMVIAIALAVAFPNLPDISDLSNYRPILPLRVFTSDNVLIGEYGEERRKLTPIKEIPKIMIDAVLAIEDADFYQHSGVSYRGFVRAALANMGRAKSQGASTITMQVARNVYLTQDKNYMRKIYEVLLTFKLEHLLSKDQILEIYMNQIFLGNRAYGFAAASEAYFDKPLKSLNIAEAAMLAGLPQAPSAYNPISNAKRARARQIRVIERMLENNFITADQAQTAKQVELKVKLSSDHTAAHAEYVAETVRQLMFVQYGNETYTRGLNVFTTLRASDQDMAYRALRRGIMDFERRQIYRGPEEFVTLPADGQALEDAVDEALDEHPDNGDVMSAVVLQADSKKIKAMRHNGETLEITGKGLEPAQSGLSDKAPPNIKVRRGAVIRVALTNKNTWEITQLPEVEGAFVALDPRTGAIRAMVGGFDFAKNKFNHATQAWRQPGSSFKPFIYSAALEKGFTPATVINDAALFYSASATGGQAWEPKNYDGRFDGPMSLRRGLAASKNMISIRILDSITPKFAQDWIAHFGFEEEKHPPYLTMALGAGAATPIQMATAYSVFANGGYRVNPWLIAKVTEQQGKVLMETHAPALNESVRAISARNAFIMDNLLGEVTISGTAAKARQILKRNDLHGKTGTTNDSIDAWFAGYQPTLAAVAWMGYDTPRKMGSNETGGGLSLPIWIAFMEHALKGVPAMPTPVPAEGLVNSGGEWFFSEFARGAGINSLGLDAQPAASGAPTPLPSAEPDEKKQILDLFKN